MSMPVTQFKTHQQEHESMVQTEGTGVKTKKRKIGTLISTNLR